MTRNLGDKLFTYLFIRLLFAVTVIAFMLFLIWLKLMPLEERD